MPASPSSFFRPGENCFRTAQADGAHLVVDAGTYYAEAYEAMQRAREAIYILGWDFHSGISLLPGQEDADPPARMLDFLRVITQRNPALHVYILVWYANPLYSRDREQLIRWKLLRPQFSRVHLVFDNELPLSASHHQKLMIIDDAVAWCGGMDFTMARWDLPEHRPDDPRRIKHSGSLYGPYHDVNIRVRGEVCRVLGDYFRQRWKDATGTALPRPAPSGTQNGNALPWTLPPAACAISRTMPAYKDRPAIAETRRMMLDIIAAAERHLYIENQYLTSREITEALCARLREENGPFLTILLPRINEQGTGNLMLMMHRAVMLWELREADRHARLGIFSPVAQNEEQIYVHSKLMIADDRLAMVGSSNLTARSMGLDSECDLTVDAGRSPACRETLLAWKTMLLAEHTGIPQEDVRALCRDRLADLHRAIADRTQPGRRLVATSIRTPTELERWMVRTDFSDYRQPLLFDATVDAIREPLLRSRHPILLHALVLAGGVVGFFLFGAALLRFTPLQAWVESILGSTILTAIPALPLGPLWMPFLFVALGLLCVPMNFVMLATAVVFPAPWALLYIWSGMMLSAWVNYGVGSLMGRKYLQRIFHRSVAKLSAAMEKREFLSFAIVRMIPVAPFGVINYVAGAYRARLLPFSAGTFLGILPGSILLVFFQRTLLQVIADPTPLNTTFLFLYGLILLTLARFFRRRL